MVGAKGWSEALLAQAGELRPREGAHVAFEHEVPVLSDARHVERRQPHLVGVASALGPEEVLASVKPPDGVFLAIERRERELEVARTGDGVSVLVVRFLQQLRR